MSSRLLIGDTEPARGAGMRRLTVRLHIDPPLLIAVATVALIGLAILYSATDQDMQHVWKQILRLGVATVGMFMVAQVPPHWLKRITPAAFATGILLLIAVLIVGYTGKGAQRWLNLGLFRFQPAEIMKLAVPMMIAWYLDDRALPPRGSYVAVCALMILVPVGLIAKQPDLGTALLVTGAGFFVLFFAGLRWRLILGLLLLGAALIPVLWHFMHGYQRQRVLIFLNPESDPLGSGYHIIQSMIALGSGGLYGKGWLNGTQSHLNFLPEGSTDFILAVFGEEFGLFGILVLFALYLFIVVRSLYIAVQAQTTFTRLLAGGLALTFFFYVFVNAGMVTGLLPVVGLPLPLISYGGTSMVTVMAGFGILMSIHTHRKLLPT
ncbi:Rod shape-determining protein RodA [bacterium BMS3Bbin12]|nr:Rod shape-determining protein RodA [bacterium BMS3Abin12]GBE47933.1 Rod shape-determining protein RodA [bacterium BMS3Bbin12]GBE49379.1 Rod shape-determining protein RodA [bacterium BMS3Bbin13]HDJ85928.1 rod shape-determining protein RodA [Chromatiales bacterium]HDK02230.1 rod shape-determining protein RodA [Gammaproteobacteria bacterium]